MTRENLTYAAWIAVLAILAAGFLCAAPAGAQEPAGTTAAEYRVAVDFNADWGAAGAARLAAACSPTSAWDYGDGPAVEAPTVKVKPRYSGETPGMVARRRPFEFGCRLTAPTIAVFAADADAGRPVGIAVCYESEVPVVVHAEARPKRNDEWTPSGWVRRPGSERWLAAPCPARGPMPW